MLVGVLRAAQQRAGADPGGEQREDENDGRKRAAGDKVVGLGLYFGERRERDTEQREDDQAKNDRVEIHELRTSVLYRPTAGRPITLDRRLR